MKSENKRKAKMCGNHENRIQCHFNLTMEIVMKIEGCGKRKIFFFSFIFFLLYCICVCVCACILWKMKRK